MSKLDDAILGLQMSLRAVSYNLNSSGIPLNSLLAWTASELERLAGEAYRIADECPQTDPCQEPIPGFDEK